MPEISNETPWARVQALPGEVVDQIAAGEVVERPAHLVKELLENALDAGATALTVDVSEGGRCIRVQDNGHGIHPDDLNLILKRHTTSKIRSADDLWRLSSFGFRGEALSSIAAVSNLRLQSKRQGEAEAYQVEAEFGKESKPDLINHDIGTTIEIRDLFANLPARLKFLKSAQAEVSAIRQLVKALAMQNPRVEFRLRVEGQLDFYAAVSGSFLDRVKSVLEQERIFLATGDREGMRLEIAFADPHVVQKTSRAIWFFVQGRSVQDRSLQAAVIEAYRGTLMHGEFPMVVVSLTVPADEVDVNIHPTKSQVKFLKPNQVFSFLHSTLRQALEEVLQPRKTVPTSVPETPRFDSPELERVQYQTKEMHSALSPQVREPRTAWTRASEAPPPAAVSLADLRAAGDRSLYEERPLDGKQESRPLSAAPSLSPVSPLAKGRWTGLQVLSQANLTYLLCQDDSGLVLVDQHAAHERVLFETLMRTWKSGQSEAQPLLFPLAVDLSGEGVEALESVRGSFEKLGLHWEILGPQTIGIMQIPGLVKEAALPGILKKVAEQVQDLGGSFEFEKAVHEIISTMACHSAIRAGQALSLDEMQSLLVQMDEFSFSQFCPHGRPVSIRYGWSELEKEFGRRA